MVGLNEGGSLFGVLLALSAHAQQPTEAPPGAEPTFTFDQMLVPTFQALDPSHQAEADRVRTELIQIVSRSHVMVAIDDVPGNWTDDYGPDLYMRACPPAQYGGCALDLAQRALAEWAVGATLDHNDDDPDHPHFLLTVYLVDVVQARDVAVFPVPLTEDEDAVFSSIAEVVDLMVEGAFEPSDIRDRDAADRAAIEVARKQVMAAYVAQLEAELGAPDEPILQPAEPPPVTVEEVVQAAPADETPPWERAGLSQRAYVRFLNSSQELDDFKRVHRGRAGALIVRAAGGLGSGPWHQRYVGATLRDRKDLQPIHVVQLLETTRGPTRGGEIEVGVGVLPVLDVSFLGGLHTGVTQIDRVEFVGESLPGEGQTEFPQIVSSHWGLRATFAPLPHAMVRPTATGGLVWWQGASIEAGSPYPPLQGPQRAILQLFPGVEIDTRGRVLGLFARGGAEIPVIGAATRLTESGGGLEDPPRPSGEAGIGWVLQMGLQLRVAPWGR